MNNTVLIESKIRQRLKLACTVMCVFCIIFIAFAFTTTMIEKKNLNGQVTEVTEVLEKVFETESNVITMQSGNEYNVVWSSDVEVDLNDYKGKTVTLVISQNTFIANPWVLGLKADGKTVVDHHDTLTKKLESNGEMKTVVYILTAIFCVATCALFIWRFNSTPTAERPLHREFAEFLAQRQPTCKERKILIWYVCAYLAVIFALLITAVVLDPEKEHITELSAAAKAVLWALLAVGVIGFAGLFVLKEWLAHKDVDFYAENFPFDFTDISHAPLRKKYKAELQKEMLKEREDHPDTYADGGNGYDVTFCENGVELTIPTDDVDEPNVAQNMPAAEEVFGNVSATENRMNVLDDILQNAYGKKFFIPYTELNFEALAHYRRNSRPFMIVVKSRLNRTDDFPEEFINDIHVAFDINLYKTLQKYCVTVENLDYLLANKKQLMMENCFKSRKKQDKIAK